MSVRDFSLSYTTSPVLIWVDNNEGMVGPSTTLNAQITEIDDVGPSTTLFYIPSSGAANVGPSASISGVTALQFIFGRDIIQYTDTTLIKTDEIKMLDVDITTDAIGAWIAQGARRNVVDVSSDLTLDKSQSSSLVVNTSAGGLVEIKLPLSADAGTHYEFVTTSDNDMRIFTEDSTISISGVIATGLLLDDIGEKILLTKIEGTSSRWVSTKQFGTIESFKNTLPPSGISGLSLHLDASVTSSITVTSSPDVDQWDDLSTSGNHVSQSTAANKPHTGGDINGLNALIWDANDDDMLGNTTAGGTFTGASGDFFIVLKPTQDASFLYFFSTTDTAANVDYFWMGYDIDAAVRVCPVAAGTVVGRMDFAGAGHGNVQVLRMTSTGSSYSASLNGSPVTLISPTVNNGAWFASTPGRDGFWIGALNRAIGIQGAFNGLIGEIIYYDHKNVTDEEADKLTTYLRNKWGAP
jgi:hypothetical protein